MGLAEGLKLGVMIGDARVKNERQAKLDARQAVLDKRADAAYDEGEAAWKNYRDNAPTAPVRIDPAQAPQPTNFQVSTAGLAPKPQSDRPQASLLYDQITGQQAPTPQGYRSQAGTGADGSGAALSNMPASAEGGGAPVQPQGLPPPQRDYVREKAQYDRAINNRNRNLALGLRDRAGLAAADAQEDVLNKRDIFNEVARMPKADLDKFGPGANISDIPVIYLGKNKNGYMVQMTDADGEPGKKFTLNESEMRQFAMASKLAEAGYGADAMAALSAAHKELGAHIGTWNSTTLASGQLNNTTVRQQNADANDAARTRLLDRAYTAKEPKEIAPELVTKLNDLSARITEAQTNGDTRLASTLNSEYGRVYGIAMSSINKVVPPQRGREPMSAKDEIEALAKLTEVYEDPGLARRHLDIETGAASPQRIAATLRGDSPAEQAAALAKWQMVNPAFAGKVAELLRGASTEPAPITRPGLPPPMVRPPTPASPTRMDAPPPATRVTPGQGQARLPWESPTGAY